jgi:hypothetical protein
MMSERNIDNKAKKKKKIKNYIKPEFNGGLIFLMKQMLTKMVNSTSPNGKFTTDSWKKSLLLTWEVPILLLKRCLNRVAYVLFPTSFQ